MKVLLWDMINPYTSRPFTFDDPNLRWGNPSYYLEESDEGFTPYGPPAKPPKKKEPFRRARRPATTTEPVIHNQMSTFKYNVAPNSQGGFTTRAVRGEPGDPAAFIAAVAAAANTTPEIAEAVLRAFFQRLLACGGGCEWFPDLLGLVSVRPTSGGSSPSPDGFHNADDINASVVITFLAEVIRDWRSTLTLESLGEVGKLTPVIESTIRQHDKAVDKYTVGRLVQVRGDRLNLDPDDLSQGIFLKAGSDPEVRVTEYATIEPGSLTILIPTGLTGPLTVRVVNHINGSLRSYTYTNPLTTP